jgi:hypothetical protein
MIHALRSPALWRRAAASIALVVGGAALGRISALSTIAARSNEPTAQVATATPQGGAAGATNAPSSTTAPSRPASRGLSESIAVYGEPNARLASQNAADAAGFASVNDAMSVLTRAQRDYQRAAAYLAEHDSGTVGGTPQTLRARLAALDEVIPKLGEALREAPQDPVLNQYYLSTADVRESTLRQLGRSLPVGVRLNSY